MAKLKQV